MTGRTADTAWSILDALEVHVAVLAQDGVILQTNRAWDEFAAHNPLGDGSPPPRIGVGANYLEVCRTAVGSSAENAHSAYLGIKNVLAGKKRHFALEYPCHSPREQRWFVMKVAPLKGIRPRQVAVTHTNVTSLKQAEFETQRKTRELTIALERIEDFAGQLKATLRLDQSIRSASKDAHPMHENGGRVHAPEKDERLNLLSRREREVLIALVRGERAADIAGRLSISAKSVSTYRSRVLEKLQARTIADLVALMGRIGAL